MHRIFLAAAGALMAVHVHAACTASSPAYTVALAELYTSEGCDSCPPADQWMSGLASRGLGPDKVVPLGLHVDYWDHIGWKDAFAQPKFTERQRLLSRLSGASFVYTPQVVLSGRDFRGWRSTAFEVHVKAVNARPARADLRLGLEPASEGLRVTVDAVSRSGAPAQLFLALTQSRIVSQVKAGENRGATLKHDHVVREWLGPMAFGADGKGRLERTIAAPRSAPTNDLGVVAFVQDASSGEILQALKLDACA